MLSCIAQVTLARDRMRAYSHFSARAITLAPGRFTYRIVTSASDMANLIRPRRITGLFAIWHRKCEPVSRASRRSSLLSGRSPHISRRLAKLSYSATVMRCLARYVRPIIASMLVLSIAVARYSAPLCHADGRAVSTCARPACQHCCCGPHAEHTCKMACCAERSSQEFPVPSAPRASSNETQARMLALSSTEAITIAAVGNRFAVQHGPSWGDTLFVSTLQTQQVRIQT